MYYTNVLKSEKDSVNLIPNPVIVGTALKGILIFFQRDRALLTNNLKNVNFILEFQKFFK